MIALAALTLIVAAMPVYDRVPPGEILRIRCDGEKWGTGTRVSRDIVLTAAHVARESCVTSDGRPAPVVYRSPGLDIAMMRLTDDAAPRWVISCSEIHFTEPYSATGFAKGIRQTILLQGAGVRSGLSVAGFAMFFGSVTAQPGMSGGPIQTAEGRLAAVTTAFDEHGNTYGRAMRDTNLCAG